MSSSSEKESPLLPSPSTTSSYNYTSSTTDMQTFCKQMLKTRIFQGQFLEKRYVSNINQYRDLIIINTNETEFCHDIEIVRNRITNFYKTKPLWFGYTSTKFDDVLSPAPHCIWTDLDTNIPFGSYWFQVKTLRFKDDEVMVKIKMLRPLKLADNQSDETSRQHLFSTTISRTTALTLHQENDNELQSLDKTLKIAGSFLEFMQIWWEDFHKTILHGLSVHCNAQNTIYFMKYVSVLFVALITSSLYAVKYLGFFTLHFMAQSRELIRVLTPILMQLIDLLNKIIGGFFILLAMIWRDCIGGAGGRSSSNRDSRRIVSPDTYQSIMPPTTIRHNNDRRTRFYSK